MIYTQYTLMSAEGRYYLLFVLTVYKQGLWISFSQLRSSYSSYMIQVKQFVNKVYLLFHSLLLCCFAPSSNYWNSVLWLIDQFIYLLQIQLQSS